MATLGLTATDQNAPCGRTAHLRCAACWRNRWMSCSDAPAKKNSSSKSRCWIASASFRGRPVFWISSRGERERSETTVMPVCSDKSSSASAGGGLRFGHGDRDKPAQANRTRGLQVKIVLRDINAAAALREERLAMPELAECGVQLKPIATGHPDAWDTTFAERFQKLRESC